MAAAMLGGERLAADERPFLEIDEPRHAELVRRVLLRLDHRLPAAVEINVDEEQPGLDPGHVEREHAGGMQIERRSDVGECIPDGERRVPWHPDLVAEVAGVAGA